MRLRIVLGCAAGLLLAATLPATSQAQAISRGLGGALACYEKTGILARLATNYNEAVAARGILFSGALIEVLASDSGTFTVLVTLPNAPDLACVLALGEDFEWLPPTAVDAPTL